ncbi:M48 family metallopeptidase [Hoyosella sp. G463]|uniref:M48 family metallopeptidase n=1 Tax=Lolliginicoccus lacisalsi TaxID=2742202 RepID=A0A927JCQ7_9ACTN|nr:M48 family metallopeptidase [Lolliginicoccus lacisalsi]MBD8506819.1 M48 family metallopeptidase [Lolliginicoccus lacisalsi]
MNFFERQIEVRKSSRRLVVLFVLAVISIIVVINLVIGGMSIANGATPAEVASLAVVVSIGTAGIIGGVSLVRTLMLRNGGGPAVARSVGAVPVPENTTDPRLRRYRNVVEEIAIASSTPVPELFIMPNERGINAFAAGYSPNDAAIAVTAGALERLNRDELQGVIAHEFAHVVNGDMRLNIRLIGVLFGITALAIIGRLAFYAGGSGRSSKNNNAVPIVLVGLVVMAAGYIGVFFGRLIKAAVSRQREHLADASAVQFTRQTEGLAGALKKIGGLDEGSRLRSAKAEDVSHMLFGEGLSFSSMFATHPPLVERIKLLEPGFDEKKLDSLRSQWRSAPPNGLEEDQRLGLAAPQDGNPAQAQPRRSPAQQPRQATGTAAPVPPQHVRVDARQLVERVGDPTASSYDQGQALRRALPEPLVEQAHDPVEVIALVCGLLLSADQRVRAAQHQILAQRLGPGPADAAWHSGAATAGLDPRLRLPLVEIAFPALRRRSPDELERLMAVLSELIGADGKVSVFEYSLGTLVFTGLHESMHHKPSWSGKRQDLRSAASAIAMLLAVLARVGNPDPGKAEAAYASGMATILPGSAIAFALPPEGVIALEQAWPVLDGLRGEDKARLVEALVTVVLHDEQLTVEEGELVRAVCAVLHCPVPPLGAMS